MPLVLQLLLVMVSKYSNFGLDTFNTFGVIGYIQFLHDNNNDNNLANTIAWLFLQKPTSKNCRNTCRSCWIWAGSWRSICFTPCIPVSFSVYSLSRYERSGSITQLVDASTGPGKVPKSIFWFCHAPPKCPARLWNTTISTPAAFNKHSNLKMFYYLNHFKRKWTSYDIRLRHIDENIQETMCVILLSSLNPYHAEFLKWNNPPNIFCTFQYHF